MYYISARSQIFDQTHRLLPTRRALPGLRSNVVLLLLKLLCHTWHPCWSWVTHIYCLTYLVGQATLSYHGAAYYWFGVHLLGWFSESNTPFLLHTLWNSQAKDFTHYHCSFPFRVSPQIWHHSCTIPPSNTPLLMMADSALPLSNPIWHLSIIILWWISDTDETHVKMLREHYLCPHFRILVIGRANVGKTTLLEKVCGVAKGTMPIIKYGKLVWVLCFLPLLKLSFLQVISLSL